MHVLIEDVFVTPKTPPILRTYMADRNGEKLAVAHKYEWIMRVTLHTTGQKYGINLTGAHLGIYEPCIEWSELCQQFYQVHSVHEFGSGAKKAMLAAKNTSSDALLEFKHTEVAMNMFLDATESHMRRGKRLCPNAPTMAWDDVLDESDVNYKLYSSNLIKAGRIAMREYLREGFEEMRTRFHTRNGDE